MISGLIRRVVVVGGTHGNELTGVYLIKKFEQFPELLHRSSFEAMTLLANPEAVVLNRRYVDRDLNRCFADEDLANPALMSYEDRRAKAIAAQLKPENQPDVDVIIDLHSTTANMGLTILPSSKQPFNLRLAAYLSELDPAVAFVVGCSVAKTHRCCDRLRPWAARLKWERSRKVFWMPIAFNKLNG